MYIEPNTNIRIYNSVPLDNTYNHTLYFANITAQQEYFSGARAKYTLANNTYQRVERGKMRIEKKADDLYDCNYLAFQNSNYGNKWFYAFITGVEYVNDKTSEVTFEIDSIQTYMFNVNIKQCFVEREHSVTDVVGEHLQPEPVDVGDLICDRMWASEYFQSYSAVIASAYDPNGPTGGVYCGLFSGVDYLFANLNNQTQIDTLKQWLADASTYNYAGSVISIFLIPTDFLPNSQTGNPTSYLKSYTKPTTIHGYTPKNKKLLTFPYNYLSVSTGSKDAVYRFERFSDPNNANFTLTGIISCTPEIALSPEGYNDLTPGSSGNQLNSVEKLVMDDFPQIAWQTDSYKIWLATQGKSTVVQGTASLLSGIGGVITENPLVATAGLMGAANAVTQGVIAQNMPPQAKGTNNGTYDVATRTKSFWFRIMQVTAENAQVIDSFFSMYGYACNKVKQPNISSRPHWNYVKTRNCVAIGSAPTDDINRICKIYDKGITFWKSAEEVGNYSLDNSPI